MATRILTIRFPVELVERLDREVPLAAKELGIDIKRPDLVTRALRFYLDNEQKRRAIDRALSPAAAPAPVSATPAKRKPGQVVRTKEAKAPKAKPPKPSKRATASRDAPIAGPDIGAEGGRKVAP